MKSMLLLFLVGFAVVFDSTKVAFNTPTHFPEPIYNFDKNPLTNAKINLGRALFYDGLLSKDGTISCASCHSPYNAFAHTDHDLSHGINNNIGTRNAPALFNLAWQNSFMWDGAINHLDVQALAPISHPDEMGEDLIEVIAKLTRSKIYSKLFEKAFQDDEITGEHTLKALSTFQLALVSANAKYDKVKLGRTNFTNQELKGYSIYKSLCSDCHKEPLFSSYNFENNGLFVDTTLNDFGKGSISKQPSDSLKFKVPSLRNLSYTYPYMHDGRFQTIKEVLKHYSGNKFQSKTLSEKLKKPYDLSGNKKADLTAFLLTLNDSSFVFKSENKFPRDILLNQHKP